VWDRMSSSHGRGKGALKISILHLKLRILVHTGCFHEDTPNSPEVIGSNTLNFKPNFKCSRLLAHTPVGVCASKYWSMSIARVKFEGAAPPKGRNVVSRKKSVRV